MDGWFEWLNRPAEEEGWFRRKYPEEAELLDAVYALYVAEGIPLSGDKYSVFADLTDGARKRGLLTGAENMAVREALAICFL